MKTILIVFLLMLFCSSASAENYRWVNDRGVSNFTDNVLNVPADKLEAARFEFAELKPRTDASVALLLAILKIQHNNSKLWDRSITQVYEYESRNNELLTKERMFKQELNSDLKRLQDRVVELEDDLWFTKRRRHIHHPHN